MTEEILIRVFRIITISQEQLKKVEQADKLKPTCSTLVDRRLVCMGRSEEAKQFTFTSVKAASHRTRKK